ncbi:nucleotide-binding domain-containing protein [Lichtheimia hyalospora FSU 10163]|nr:nucleotide-binding domain-containing protein [Lichtheimia hyalospora FSU 10163]
MTSNYTPPVPNSKIIIVGAGALGLSTAFALSKKEEGYDIHVFDRDQVPVPDAASTDINKSVRMEYGNDTLYLNLMLEALPMWHEWNHERAERGESPVFHNSGVLMLCRNGKLSKYEQQSMQCIQEAGHGHVLEELTTPESILEKFPHFKDAVNNGYNNALYNKEGGWCHSSEAIKHVYNKCVHNGVHFTLDKDKGCFERLYTDENGAAIGIVTKDGTVHYGDRVIMATGPWTAGLIGLEDKLRATGQVVIQFKPPTSSIFHMPGQPVWSADVSNTGYYGFPMNPDGKIKIARHAAGYLNPRTDNVSIPRTQTTNPADTIPIKALHDFREFLAGFFPETSSMDIAYGRVCWYSDTADGHFLIAPHPKIENLIIASGDSGHLMKFLPNIGIKVAEIIEGKENEYTKVWGWREGASNQSDGSRDSASVNVPILEDPLNEDTRMATLEELKA